MLTTSIQYISIYLHAWSNILSHPVAFNQKYKLSFSHLFLMERFYFSFKALNLNLKDRKATLMIAEYRGCMKLLYLSQIVSECQELTNMNNHNTPQHQSHKGKHDL